MMFDDTARCETYTDCPRYETSARCAVPESDRATSKGFVRVRNVRLGGLYNDIISTTGHSSLLAPMQYYTFIPKDISN